MRWVKSVARQLELGHIAMVQGKLTHRAREGLTHGAGEADTPARRVTSESCRAVAIPQMVAIASILQ